MVLRRVHVLLIVALLFSGACVGSKTEDLVFGSGPRFPSDEGLVTSISHEDITLDKARRYEIRDDVQSFSTYDGTVTPLLHHKSRYVHLGLDDSKRLEWVAGIGLVIGADTATPVVVYNGVVDKVDEGKRRVTFEDGTVLTLLKQVALPERGQRISAKIQPFKHVVVEIVLQ